MMASNPEEENSKSNLANYMKGNSRRIIIREKCKGGVAGMKNPVLVREIVVKKSATSPDNDSFEKPETATDIRKTSRDDSPSSSNSPVPSEKTVTFDPEPRSHTILSKSATPNVRGREKRPAVVSLSPVTTLNNQNGPTISRDANAAKSLAPKATDTSTTTAQKGTDSATTAAHKAKSYQAMIDDLPRIHKVLPEDCNKKYERFTYLPGIARCTSTTGTIALMVVGNTV